MIHQLSILTQKIFFPNTKIKPNPQWCDTFNTLGVVKKIPVFRDGGNISTLHLSSNDRPNGVVILGHPISKKAKYFYGENSRVQIYLENNFDVVVFDFNGFGESDRIDLRYWKDAQVVINYYKNIFSNRPFVLHGVSFGAFHVLRAHSSLPKNSTVVLENMSRSLYDYWKRWIHTRMLVRILEKLPVRAFKEMEVIEQFKNWNRDDIEVLAFACENDKYTPSNEMKDALSNLKAKKLFVLLPEASHLLGPQQQYDLYYKSLNSALKKYRGKNESRVTVTL